jgi:superfamily II DNA/RNA helicase
MSSEHTPVHTDTFIDNSDSPAGTHGSAHAVEHHAAPQTVAEMEAAARDAKAKKAHDEIFTKTETFASMGLNPMLLRGVADAGFDRPTVIQGQLIPFMLTGRDILGQAKTGTGKTAAFGLPLLHMVQPGLEFQAIILAPTRELAVQIAHELADLGQHTGIKVAPIFGGESVAIQAKKLKRGPEILVGTPGRFQDMMERGLIQLKNVKFAILDEVDRMLDIGFREDIRRILGACPKDRQTVFVSATISGDIDRLARNYMRDPEKLVVATGSLTVSLVQQHYLAVQSWDKKRLLVHLLQHEEPALTLVFCRMKRTVDDLTKYLNDKGVEAHAIHGDLPQGKRNSIMKKLRSGDLEVLIASDLASRGIDVEGITHVINYDLPDDVEMYVHRIGRTARAGRGGVAWSLVTPEQGGLLTDIERLINAEIPKMDYPDFQPGPVPERYRQERQQDDQRRELARRPSRFAAASGPPMPGAATESGPAPEAGGAPTGPKAPAPPKPVIADASKFPGGIVPTKMPSKRMQGRMPTSRGR